MNFKNAILIPVILIFSGCVSSGERLAEIYPAPKMEAEWIRSGEPIQFENELWYPVDDVENLIDDEMLPMGTYNSVQFFVEKKDIRSFDRLYTKFGKHKYRVFEKPNKND